ncbi:uncharacterized protein LOC113211792 isoform X2 [Frankliniella occidentalis]|uniref:Uncharacterized protein LOC113211792 isoform X2 n=1 Tax=Frankliniella occidentalis TaxID=133901 RepID=A0A9C6WSE8_FRAOC|nr:uncharacterized protein LOC113211792 isoform X2 [Frankliniella occidentalis]
MYAVLALILAGLASVQGQSYTCPLCGTLSFMGKEYCCADLNDNYSCCTFEDYYYKGGFLDSKTLYITIAVAAGILVLLLVLICCCCCACCPCNRRRRQGVVLPGNAPAYQPSSVQYHPAQYPPQPSSNPYLAPAASAPAYPTLPKV